MSTVVEGSRPSSPTEDMIQQGSPEKPTECRKSPTTVIEAEAVAFTQTFPSSDAPPTFPSNDEVNDEDTVTIVEEQSFVTPNLKCSNTPEERYSRLRRRQIERRKYLNIMPTIQEVSSYEEQTGEAKSVAFATDDILLHIQTLSGSVNNVDELKKVHQKIEDASLRAAKGNEEKALAIYKEVLLVLEKEVTRVEEQIENLRKKQTKAGKKKLYVILHEEWAENAMVVADVKTKMATIYERQEDYSEAESYVQQARVLYQREVAFDKQYNNNGSSSREKEMSMEIMMEQIEEAMESHTVRKSLHETVERIREKIIATTDETSRAFLYEDIFDKLSTVLSLELMYLGEEHPQIAYTKGLLAKCYGEIKQNEKALKVMSEAVLICEKTLGDLHPETGSKYQDMAKLYEHEEGEENQSKAIELYEKAITNFKNSEGDVSEKICSSLNRVAILYMQQESYDIAIERLQTAIHISEENYRERSDDASTEPIQLWLNLSECHTLKENPALSSEALRNALHIQREKRKVYDLTARKGSANIPSLISNPKISLTLQKLGKSCAEESKFEESSTHFTEALSILRADLAKARETIKFNPTMVKDLPGQEDEVASVLYDLAKIKQTDNKYSEAIELYKESLELRKESDKQRPAVERCNNIDCALCLAGIGSIEMIQNKDSDAFKSFNQAIYYAKQEGILDSDPITLMLWEKSRIAAENMNKAKNPKSKKSTLDDIVISPLEDKAKELRKTRDFQNSIKTINTVIGMKRAHVEKVAVEEQNTNAKRQLAASLIFKGEVALLLGEKKDATDCMNEASTLLKESGADDDDVSVMQIEKFHKATRQRKIEYIQMFSGVNQIDSKVRKNDKAHSRTAKTSRLRNIGHKIRMMKQKTESTMGEF